mmetsp:Transcript_130377/g.237084  ORF Transcript_130377/g.237084 Transcript_130377/m.237084 type:complete len:617 (+) Transcript_130377:68-1918(+)
MIEYSEDYLLSLIFRHKGSVAARASVFAIPAALITIFILYLDEISPGFREDHGLKELASSQLWAVSTSVLAILLAFRTNRAMARFWEGTGLLHQMRGEWFDSVSCCVTFSRAALPTKFVDVHEFRHTIVRLMSLCHGSALEEIAGNAGDGELETIDSFGLNVRTLKHLKDCKVTHHFNTVEVLLHMIQSLITKNLDDGVLKIPPPILSRVYQTLSRGFVNLLNAKKIADTRFPFPYAQTIAFLLFLNIVLTPMMISCLISSKVWAPIFAFVPIFGMFSLNFIGVELENPFGNDDNDLPLDHFQTEMNKCLLMLLEDNADLIAGVSKQRCIREFSKLKGSMRPSEMHGHNPGGGPPVRRTSTTGQPFRRLSQFEDLVGADDDWQSACSSPEGSEPGNLYSFLLERDGGYPGMPEGKSAPSAAPKAPPAAPLVQVVTAPEPSATAQAAEEKRTIEVVEREPSSGPPPSIQIEPKMVMGAPEGVELKAQVEAKLGAAPSQLIADSIRDCNDVLIDMTEYDRALQELKELIQTQLVSEFNRSVTALKDFSDAINALPQPGSSRIQAAQVRWKQVLDSDSIMRDAFKPGGVLPASSAGPSGIRPAASPPLPSVPCRAGENL